MTDQATRGEHLLLAKDHTVNSRRRTCAHVILTHDLNTKTRTIFQIFRYGVDVHPDACAALVEALADDILRDVEILIEDLEHIR